MDIPGYLLLVNSIVTFFCGFYPLFCIYNKKVRRHSFFYLTSLGMIIYGSQLLLRFFGFPFNRYIIFLTVLVYVLYTLGLWSLTAEKKLFYFMIVSYAIIPAIWVSGIGLNSHRTLMEQISMALTFLPLIGMLIYHRVELGRIFDKFILGWFLLLLTNLIFFGPGWIPDIFATFSKIIILMGIFDNEYVVLGRRLYEGKPSPVDTMYGNEGNIYVIPLSINEKMKTLDKVRDLIDQSLSKDASIYVFSFQDITPHNELWRLKWIDPEKIHVLLFSSSAEKANSEFNLTPMDLTKISAMLTVVSKVKGSTVIFMDLSHLIHTFSVGPVYKTISSKLGVLRENEIDFYAFMYPETHSNKTVINLFTHLADEIET